MNADGLQTFVGGISREEGHKHMLENSYLESLSCLCQNGGKKKKIAWTVFLPDDL